MEIVAGRSRGRAVAWAPAAAAFILLLGGAEEAAAQAAGAEEGDGFVARRLSELEAGEIRVDGWLTEEVWSRLPPLTGFRQREPLEGQPASERTEVRVAYDDETLYVAVMAFDTEPSRVVARILQRDRLMEPDFFGGGLAFAGDDAVALLLDPFHDHRNGVVFATNPNGAEFEALISDEGSEINVDWRGVWEVAGTRNPDGWSAEFAIPWRTLRYPDAAPDRPWGLNVFRVIRRKNEDVLWRSWNREGGGFQRVSRAGHLLGLQDLPRAGLNVEAKPFLLAGQSRELEEEIDVIRSDTDYEVGLDLKAELRPGLVLDATLNTDFAQVEVDDEQVNLTRFDLFFPEKRDFFLENSGIFEFGVPGNPFEPPPFVLFFSRRIGIHDDGEVPILGGARLTGRVGGQTVGLLNMVTEAAFGVERESFSVARLKRDVGESGYLGAMLTDRRGGEAWNTTAGVDGQLVLADAWILDAFYARSTTQGAGGDDHAYRVGLDYTTGERYGLYFNHLTVGEEMEAASGFVLRTDTRRTDLFVRRRWRPPVLGLRLWELWVGGNYVASTGGALQDWAAGISLAPEWESGENLILFLNGAETVVDESFELSDSLEIPPGRYRADHVGWFGGTSRNRWVYLDVNGMASSFLGGTLLSAGGTLTMAPTPQLGLGVGYARNVVDVPSGSFTADILTLRTSYSFSTRFTTNVLVQYNSLANAFSTNVRLNFIHRPGSDFFLVFTENRGAHDRLWDLSDRGLVMKVTYLARL